MSFANPTNGTWQIFVKDNGTDAGSYEQDPVAFVYVPKTNDSVVSGKFRGDGTRLIYSGATPRFAVINIGAGVWRLTIPGQNPNSGVLIISAEGGYSQNSDNIVSYEADGDGWLIQSRDLPGNPPSLQTPGGGTEPVASFIFIPSIAAMQVSPADEAMGVGVSPTLNVNVPHPISGNFTVTFYGRPHCRYHKTPTQISPSPFCRTRNFIPAPCTAACRGCSHRRPIGSSLIARI